MTGQTEQELFSGLVQYGPDHIDRLVEKALKEKKMVVFIPELTEGQELGQGRYVLRAL